MQSIFDKADAAKTREAVNALPAGTFCEAYVKLLCQIRERYPQCKVVCIIGDYLSQSIEESTLQIAAHYGAKTVNLFRVNGFNDLGGYSGRGRQSYGYDTVPWGYGYGYYDNGGYDYDSGYGYGTASDDASFL